jgi:hypothetical protein
MTTACTIKQKIFTLSPNKKVEVNTWKMMSCQLACQMLEYLTNLSFPSGHPSVVEILHLPLFFCIVEVCSLAVVPCLKNWTNPWSCACTSQRLLVASSC